MAHKQVLFRSAAREKILRGATHIGGRRPRHARAPVQIGLDRERNGSADRLQRRRHHCQGIRFKGPGRNLGARMLRQAAERTATWLVTNQHLDHPRTRDLRRRSSQCRGRGERYRYQARVGSWRQVRHRGVEGVVPTCLDTQGKGPGGRDFRSQTTMPSASLSHRPWKKSAAKASSRSRNPRPRRPCSMWSKVCSSTADSCLHTSSPMPRRWRPALEDPLRLAVRPKNQRPQGFDSVVRTSGKIRPAATRDRRDVEARLWPPSSSIKFAERLKSCAVKAPGFGTAASPCCKISQS